MTGKENMELRKRERGSSRSRDRKGRGGRQINREKERDKADR